MTSSSNNSSSKADSEFVATVFRKAIVPSGRAGRDGVTGIGAGSGSSMVKALYTLSPTPAAPAAACPALSRRSKRKPAARLCWDLLSAYSGAARFGQGGGGGRDHPDQSPVRSDLLGRGLRT